METPTDPKQDVRQQFEAWFARECPTTSRMANSGEREATTCRNFAFKGHQAALQSPAVRELVEALSKAEEFVDRHSEPWYTSGQSLLAEIRAALRTLGAGHVE